MTLHNEIKLLTYNQLHEHPFDNLNKNQIKRLMPQYLAMSTAFPYIQAGSQLPLIKDVLYNSKHIPKSMEVTSVVANFISFDETGGINVLENFGKRNFDKLLETNKWFHGNQLVSDIRTILEQDIKPDFADNTVIYLEQLLAGLSCKNAQTRCAHMVAFEAHADRMISALSKSISNAYSINSESLPYFQSHVGGDDPAEAYHVKITQAMTDQIVSLGTKDFFFREVTNALDINKGWCCKIASLSNI